MTANLAEAKVEQTSKSAKPKDGSTSVVWVCVLEDEYVALTLLGAFGCVRRRIADVHGGPQRQN